MAKATRAQRIKKASAQRRKEQRAATRRAILDAAIELFQEEGYENFSLRQVAEAIGYTPTTIYLYFKDKDDLLFHTAMEGFDTFGKMLQEAYDSSIDPLERLKAEGQAYVRFALENPVNYRLMFMQRGEFLERETPEGCESVIDSFNILETTVKECLEAGHFKPGDARSYAAIIWASVHGLASLAIATTYFSEEDALALTELSNNRLIEGMKQ